jgi:1,4-alpha-glucan branching enzyme
MIVKEPARKGTVRITFSMPASIWADTIHLVGDFNDWDQTATPLRLGDQGWSISLELEAGKEYQYRYLVNGTDWYNDWRADRYVPNEYGGDNSVVIAVVQREFPYENTRQPTSSYNNIHTTGELVYGKRRQAHHHYRGHANAYAAMKNTT